jgi:hypothetical protein
MAEPPTAFPAIGDQVAAADAANDAEPRPIDVIDSLCMDCHENVSIDLAAYYPG